MPCTTPNPKRDGCDPCERPGGDGQQTEQQHRHRAVHRQAAGSRSERCSRSKAAPLHAGWSRAPPRRTAAPRSRAAAPRARQACPDARCAAANAARMACTARSAASMSEPDARMDATRSARAPSSEDQHACGGARLDGSDRAGSGPAGTRRSDHEGSRDLATSPAGVARLAIVSSMAALRPSTVKRCGVTDSLRR
jgi:hypothetical protein